MIAAATLSGVAELAWVSGAKRAFQINAIR